MFTYWFRFLICEAVSHFNDGTKERYHLFKELEQLQKHSLLTKSAATNKVITNFDDNDHQYHKIKIRCQGSNVDEGDHKYLSDHQNSSFLVMSYYIQNERINWFGNGPYLMFSTVLFY